MVPPAAARRSRPPAPARDYLRSRGLAGDVARQFKLGWAPDDWDALSRARRASTASCCATPGWRSPTGRDRLQDAFRARVLFPIFSDTGEAVAFGGRILPGSTDPAKYKNSPETPIYAKSKTLYGLNWAKADIVAADQVVVCEGYTDVIGFHRAGVPRAVATCGTAFTEDHVRLLKRYASRVVLAFDADAAGQGAAERFYEWEQKYQVAGVGGPAARRAGPGELAQRDPDGAGRGRRRRAAVPRPSGCSGCWTASRRARRRTGPAWPSGRWRSSTSTPTPTCASCTPARSPPQVGLPVADLVRVAERRDARARRSPVAPAAAHAVRENAEFVGDRPARPGLGRDRRVAGRGAVRRRRRTAGRSSPWPTPTATSTAAIDAADPEAREVLERAAVADLDVDPEAEARNLIAAAVRRELAPAVGDRRSRRRSVTTREARLAAGRTGDADRGGRGGGVVARLAASSDGATIRWGTVKR